MPEYLYEGKTADGKVVKGSLNAADEKALYDALKRDGAYLTSFRLKEEVSGRKKQLKAMELSEFCRQLSSLTAAGITLSRALSIILMGKPNSPATQAYKEVQKLVQQGQPLSDALAQQGIFPEMMINMFRAGEASGQLEQVAAKLATHYQKEHRMDNRIKSATMYPKILAAVCVLAVLIIFLVVMPELEPMFQGMEIPAATRAMMAFSALLSQQWYILLIIALCAVAAVQIAFTSPQVRFYWDKLKLQMPVIKKHMRIIYTARFARTQSSLYSSGLSMLRSLEIASYTLGNAYLTSQFTQVIRQVRSGEMLSQAIQQVDGFDSKLSPTIFVGEETGRLDQMLENIADNYEYEADVALSKLTGMIEPLMIVFMAGIVLMIMLGVMLPIWSMYGNVN
ncbi:MAG: type II secretion system F family protein [Candidatus Fournierella pullistercoris]|uniref:Type II secretion system F family protein n=1 Tax=Candidatus Allofournierella pullistercoris TaxID=2838597 RepID=A0A948T116_9FIRM|nr:type II secretion system F family protein [Candidatus Fournierella pullistercoris]